jgi:hypothetical protein
MPGTNDPSQYTIEKPNPQNAAKYLRPTLVAMIQQASPEDVAWVYEQIGDRWLTNYIAAHPLPRNRHPKHKRRAPRTICN